MTTNTRPASAGVELLTFPTAQASAENASARGQRRYVRLSATRLLSLLVGALAGAVQSPDQNLDPLGVVVLVSFTVAAIAEVLLLVLQPERDWYAGRALSESAKTLSWRYAVRGEPFGPEVSSRQAAASLHERMTQVIASGKDRIPLTDGPTRVTESMEQLRRAPYEERRKAYLEQRTLDQQRWYSSKAAYNKRRATTWRCVLLTLEVAGVAVAALALNRRGPLDFVGVMAAVVAAGAAWLTLKQHSQLASAYQIAATELALQSDVLRRVAERDWPQAIADAEEAISREHTMWLASRGHEPAPRF